MNWWRKFYDTPVKNKAETYEKDTEMGRNNDYTIIIQNILFKTLQTNSNRFKQANWIIKCWFKTTKMLLEDIIKIMLQCFLTNEKLG